MTRYVSGQLEVILLSRDIEQSCARQLSSCFHLREKGENRLYQQWFQQYFVAILMSV
jgi:hypothetical protein